VCIVVDVEVGSMKIFTEINLDKVYSRDVLHRLRIHYKKQRDRTRTRLAALQKTLEQLGSTIETCRSHEEQLTAELMESTSTRDLTDSATSTTHDAEDRACVTRLLERLRANNIRSPSTRMLCTEYHLWLPVEWAQRDDVKPSDGAGAARFRIYYKNDVLMTDDEKRACNRLGIGFVYWAVYLPY
jgi:hypothetical protein